MIGPVNPEKTSWQGRPHAHSGFEQVVIALTYLRTNQTQAVIAEAHHTSQATVSRIIGRVTALLATVLGSRAPTADDLDPAEQLIIDGTLAPTWSWKAHPEDYSGKHHTTGRNLQVACDLNGRLRWISDDLPGSIHDSKALRLHGLADPGDPHPWNDATLIGDKGYIGMGMLTPIRRQPGQEHLEQWQQDYNHDIGAIRFLIERANAHLKNWTILHTDYRRPWKTTTQTITAVIGLHCYRMSL